jgi:hypothetical protein
MAPEARTPVFCTTFDPLWHQWAPKFPSLVRTLFCNTCALVKSQKIPSYVSPTRATKKLEIIHSEVCGWISPSSFGGYRYFVTFRDDFSRYVWVYCLRNKEDVYETFVTWKAQVKENLDVMLYSYALMQVANTTTIWGFGVVMVFVLGLWPLPNGGKWIITRFGLALVPWTLRYLNTSVSNLKRRRVRYVSC